MWKKSDDSFQKASGSKYSQNEGEYNTNERNERFERYGRRDVRDGRDGRDVRDGRDGFEGRGGRGGFRSRGTGRVVTRGGLKRRDTRESHEAYVKDQNENNESQNFTRRSRFTAENPQVSISESKTIKPRSS
jgi:hypothetical protein